MNTETRDPKAQLRVMLIIWAALLMACFIYGAVLVILSREFAAAIPDETAAELAGQTDPILSYVLAGVAFMSTVMGIVIPPIAVKQLKSSEFVKLQTAMILRCALFDSIAIIGMVGGILQAFSMVISLGFIVAAATMIAMTLPWLLSSHERITHDLERQT